MGNCLTRRIQVPKIERGSALGDCADLKQVASQICPQWAISVRLAVNCKFQQNQVNLQDIQIERQSTLNSDLEGGRITNSSVLS